MINQKLSEPPHNLIMKSEPAPADLHRILDATPENLFRLNQNLTPTPRQDAART